MKDSPRLDIYYDILVRAYYYEQEPSWFQKLLGLVVIGEGILCYELIDDGLILLLACLFCGFILNVPKERVYL
jgi:hypothetical protein